MPDNSHGLLMRLIEGGLGWLWLVSLAIWGGASSYVTRIRRTKVAFSFAELLGELLVSSFAGITTAYICQSMGWDWYITAAATGLSGHMGARAIGLAESIITKRLSP